MKKIFAIFLILTHVLWCLPDVVYGGDNDFSEKKTEKEAFQDLEDDKEESIIPLKNSFSGKVILKFYFLEDNKTVRSCTSVKNVIFSIIEQPFYLKYSNLRI